MQLTSKHIAGEIAKQWNEVTNVSKEKSKDKGGTLAGLSKSYKNNRGTNGKMNDPDNTTNRALKGTGHKEI